MVNKKESIELYNWFIKNLSGSIDDWSVLRKTKEDKKIQIDNFGAIGRSIYKYYNCKEIKLITILTTIKLKLRLEIFETGIEGSKKKVVMLKYGAPMSSMEDMMFEQFPYRADKRSLNKAVGKMLKHLVDKKFI